MAAAFKAQTWITNREGPHFLKPPGSGIHKMKHLDMVKEKKKKHVTIAYLLPNI